jgi:hypothetical protein
VLTAGQVLVAGSAVPLTVVPAGYGVAVSAFGGTIYVGTSGSVTTSTGAPLSGFCPLPPVPVTSAPSPLFAISAGGTVTAGWFLAGPR